MYDFVRWSANCDKSVLFSSEFLLLRSIFFRIFHPLLQKINGSSQNIPITHFKWEEPDIRYKPTSAILSCQILRQITLGASAETFHARFPVSVKSCEQIPLVPRVLWNLLFKQDKTNTKERTRLLKGWFLGKLDDFFYIEFLRKTN